MWTKRNVTNTNCTHTHTHTQNVCVKKGYGYPYGYTGVPGTTVNTNLTSTSAALAAAAAIPTGYGPVTGRTLTDAATGQVINTAPQTYNPYPQPQYNYYPAATTVATDPIALAAAASQDHTQQMTGNLDKTNK